MNFFKNGECDIKYITINAKLHINYIFIKMAPEATFTWRSLSPIPNLP